MHKTDAANNVANEFSDGTAPTTPGTSLGAKWHNAVQRELVAVVEGAGLVLSDADDNQVLDALTVLYGRLAAANTWALGQTITAGGLTVTAGGATVTAGGLTVTAGGATVTAGGLSVVAGGGSVVGTAPAQGGVAGASTLEVSGALSAVSGEGHALITGAKFNAGGNTGRLNFRTQNSATVVDWHEVRAGLSYDVDTTIGVGGSLYFSATEGLRVSGAVAATASAPANALELVNGNLKLTGTAPNSDEALTNTLTPANVVKVWVVFTTDGAGGITISDGFGVSSLSINGSGNVVVNFAQNFSNTNYAPFWSMGNGSTVTLAFDTFAVGSVVVIPSSGSFAATTRRVHLSFIGRQ